jgi:hypothetical protein
MRPRGHGCVRADASPSARTHGHVCVDAPCFTSGNFEKDAIVRPSHGRPRGHRPIVRLSVHPSKNVHVTTMSSTIDHLKFSSIFFILDLHGFQFLV